MIDMLPDPQAPQANPLLEANEYVVSADPQDPQESLWLKCSAEYLDLPLLYEDMVFVDSYLERLMPKDATDVLRHYEEVWIKATEDEPNVIRKENAGRFAANTWIRTRNGLL